MALVATDYDAAHGVLSVTKARVQGIEKDVTKTAEDRRVVLCPRAIAVLERQLDLRREMIRLGAIHHEHLFFTAEGKPIRRLGYPYAARHFSVSWDLMLGRNPLWVAKQQGHRISTMLSIYAAWVEGPLEIDVETIREFMNAGAQRSRVGTLTVNAPPSSLRDVPAGAPIDERRKRSRRRESALDRGNCDPIAAGGTPP